MLPLRIVLTKQTTCLILIQLYSIRFIRQNGYNRSLASLLYKFRRKIEKTPEKPFAKIFTSNQIIFKYYLKFIQGLEQISIFQIQSKSKYKVIQHVKVFFKIRHKGCGKIIRKWSTHIRPTYNRNILISPVSFESKNPRIFFR